MATIKIYDPWERQYLRLVCGHRPDEAHIEENMREGTGYCQR